MAGMVGNACGTGKGGVRRICGRGSRKGPAFTHTRGLPEDLSLNERAGLVLFQDGRDVEAADEGEDCVEQAARDHGDDEADVGLGEDARLGA